MKEELHFMKRMLTREEEHIIDLELLRDAILEGKGVVDHCQGRIDHANKGIESINSIIDHLEKQKEPIGYLVNGLYFKNKGSKGKGVPVIDSDEVIKLYAKS